MQDGLTDLREAPYDEVPLKFRSCREAVGFAEQWAAKSLTTSQMAHILRMAVHNNRRGSISAQDIQDEARTISLVLSSRVPSPLNQLYRYVYGTSSRSLDAADHCAHIAWNGPDGGKTFSKLRDLALVLLASYRAEHREGRHFSKKYVAEQVRITRERLYDVKPCGWMRELSALHAEIQRGLVLAENELEYHLRAVGVVV